MAKVATITIDHTKVAGDLDDYVVAVVNNSDAGWAELYNVATEGGGDIRVFKAGGSVELSREIVSFTVIGETGEIHIKYTGTLSGSIDTDIEIHADGTSSDYAVGATYGRNAVWVDYAFVFHMDDTTDSTGNYTPTLYGEMSFGGQTGKLGDATFLDGTDDFFVISTSTAITNVKNQDVSFSAWVKEMANNSSAGEASNILGNYLGNNPTPNQFYAMWVRNDGAIQLAARGDDNAETAATSFYSDLDTLSWNYISTTKDGVDFNLYKEATLLETVSFSVERDTNPTSFTSGELGFGGGVAVFGRYLIGYYDEARLRNLPNSANWTTTEYNNQDDVGTFYSVAAEGSATPQSLTASATGAATVATVSTFGRTLNAAAGVTAMIEDVKSLTRTLTGSATGAATITTANLLFQTLTATASAAVSIATEAKQGVLMIASTAATATVDKTLSLTRTLTSSSTAQATISRAASLTRTLTGSAAATATVSATKTFFQTLTAAVSGAASVVRGGITFSRTLTAISKVSAALNEYFYKRKYTDEDEDYTRKY